MGEAQLHFTSLHYSAAASVLDGLVHLSALRATGTVNVRIVGIDVTAAAAAEDVVFALGRFEAPPAKLGVNAHPGKTSQEDNDVSKKQARDGHAQSFRELPPGRWCSAAESCATGKSSGPRSVTPPGWVRFLPDYDSAARTARRWLARGPAGPPLWNRCPKATRPMPACPRPRRRSEPRCCLGFPGSLANSVRAASGAAAGPGPIPSARSSAARELPTGAVRAGSARAGAWRAAAAGQKRSFP